MHSPVVLLTHSRRLFDRLRLAAPAGALHQVPCLSAADSGAALGTVMVDPRAVDPTCLRTLADWRRARAGRDVVYLAFQVPAHRLVLLPRVHPGQFLEVERAVDRLRRLHRVKATAGAWDDWAAIVSTGDRDARARAFLGVALRARGRGAVGEAAAALRIGRRHLSRLCLRWFGYPPAAIVRQARLLRVTRDLIGSDLSLSQIARRHGFSSRQAMTRLFAGSAGLPPSVFRRDRLAGALGLSAPAVPSMS